MLLEPGKSGPDHLFPFFPVGKRETGGLAPIFPVLPVSTVALRTLMGTSFVRRRFLGYPPARSSSRLGLWRNHIRRGLQKLKYWNQG